MAIEIRPTRPDELRAAASLMRRSLLEAPPDDEQWARHEAGWADQHSFSAWDGDRCVGHVSWFQVDTTVPGGAVVPTAAVTRAGVDPVVARQGVFTALMAALHTDAREAGNVLMSLRASEATIYDRFGYGVAASAVAATIDTIRARPFRGAAAGTFETIEPSRILEVVPDLYATSFHRPGTVSRPRWLWERYFEDAVGRSNQVVVAHRGADGELDGYIHYETTWDGQPFGSDAGQAKVHEVWANESATELALWNFVCNVSLIRTVTVDELASDSVVFTAAADRRAVRVTSVWDEQWVHPLDVGALVAAREWHRVEPVSISVEGVPGAFRLGADAGPTDAAADIHTDPAGFGAAYLGSTSWWQLAEAGRARAASADSIRRADAASASRPAAFCGSFF